MDSSELAKSVLLGLCFTGIGIFILSVLNKNANNPYLIVLGLCSLLVGLMCFQPLLDFILTGLKFVYLIVIVVCVIAMFWKSPTTEKEVTQNSKSKEATNTIPKDSHSRNINQNVSLIGISEIKTRPEIYEHENGYESYYYDDKGKQMFIGKGLDNNPDHVYYYNESGIKVVYWTATGGFV